jgi:hypothetical protein
MAAAAAGPASAPTYQVLKTYIPLANQWDVYPILGTPIGVCRIIYGIFLAAIACCSRNQKQSTLAKAHITRGFQSLFSCFPGISKQMRKEDEDKAKAEHKNRHPDGPADVDAGRTGAGGHGLASQPNATGGVDTTLSESADHTYDD